MLDRILKLLVPTPMQIFGSVTLASAILVGEYQTVLFPRIYQYSQVDGGLVAQSLRNVLAIINNIPFVQTGVQVIFWALVGIACYVIYLGITDAIIEARNEVVIDTEYSNRTGGASAWIHRYGKQLVAAAGLIIFLLIAALALLPLWFSLFDPLVFDALSYTSVVSGVGAWLGLIVTIYTAWMLTEITLAADRL